MNKLMERYLKVDALPTLFCPGCGNGIVQHAAVSAIEQLGMRKDVACVSGIGCSSWIPCYLDMDVMHTTHGRALAFATGLKLARPEKEVLVFTGDGDCMAIGGNHLLHACRRNIDLCVVMVNNHIYGMTGGQKSPATPFGTVTKTSPWGSYDDGFDGAALAISLGATYVARWTTAQPVQLSKSIQSGIKHTGFAFIEVIAQCPTQSGKEIYGTRDAAKITEYLKENSWNYKAGVQAPEGKIVVGVLHHNNDRGEFCGKMLNKQAEIQAGKRKKDSREEKDGRAGEKAGKDKKVTGGERKQRKEGEER